MQALQLTGTGLRYTTDYPQPQCLPGDALIRVRVAGICSTDLEIVKGDTPDSLVYSAKASLLARSLRRMMRHGWANASWARSIFRPNAMALWSALPGTLP